jgi:hypothetical protein
VGGLDGSGDVLHADKVGAEEHERVGRPWDVADAATTGGTGGALLGGIGACAGCVFIVALCCGGEESGDGKLVVIVLRVFEEGGWGDVWSERDWS